jgi:hypothetical protein
VAVVVSIASGVVAVMAWRSSADTERKQLALAQQVYQHSVPVLGGEGGIDIYTSTGKHVYAWNATADSEPDDIPLVDWKKDSIFIHARLTNTGGQAAVLANYGLAYSEDDWMPAGSSNAVCKVEAYVDWKTCNPDGELIQPGRILFIGFYLTPSLIEVVPDEFRQNIVISYEAGAYNVQRVAIPIPIPQQSDLGY